MSEQVEKYGQALAAYAAASEHAARLVKDLKNFHEAVNYRLDGFLQETYGASLGVRSASGPVRFTMENWPSREEVDGAFGALARSFTDLRRAWTDLPANDKAYLKAPPIKPELA